MIFDDIDFAKSKMFSKANPVPPSPASVKEKLRHERRERKRVEAEYAGRDAWLKKCAKVPAINNSSRVIFPILVEKLTVQECGVLADASRDNRPDKETRETVAIGHKAWRQEHFLSLELDRIERKEKDVE
jgi:hypothetical protein